MPTDEHVDIVGRWFDDLFTRGDLDAVNDLVAPDFVAHGQGGSEATRGREAFREWLRWYTSALPRGSGPSTMSSPRARRASPATRGR